MPEEAPASAPSSAPESSSPSPAPASEAPAAEGQSFDWKSAVNSDGTLAENWYSGLPAEDHGIYSRFKGVPDMAKTLAEQKRALSKRALGYPGEDAGEEDWATWRESAAVPKEVEHALPSDVEKFVATTGFTPEFTKAFAEASIEAGVPGPALQKQFVVVEKLSETLAADMRNQQKEAYENGVDSLKVEWGSDVEGRIEGAKETFVIAAEKAGIPRDRALEIINDPAVGNNLDVIKTFASLKSTMDSMRFRDGASADALSSQYASEKDLVADAMKEGTRLNAQLFETDASGNLTPAAAALNDRVNKHFLREAEEADERLGRLA